MDALVFEFMGLAILALCVVVLAVPASRRPSGRPVSDYLTGPVSTAKGFRLDPGRHPVAAARRAGPKSRCQPQMQGSNSPQDP